MPVKMALAPDGRLFFNELGGNVRVVGADGVLRASPVAVVPVRTGGEQGLIGLALAPDFAETPSLFVFATTEAGDGKPVRNRILRLVLDGDVAVATQVIVDDLPAGALHNGGDLQFFADGTLLVSLGDTGVDALAQADGSRAGRILRYTASGAIPANNPIPADPEWCRGLRNPFDLALHPVTDGLFATENGPTFGDELEYVVPGRNFGWPELPSEFPGALIGNRLREWTPVIVPTGIVFHPGTGFGAAYADNLFLAGYDVADLRRLVMSGAAYTDIDEERPFARWLSDGVEHRPLDLVVDAEGSLLVSTFTAIWRIRRY
jgi:glucose/arabinose dehydrogenase